MTTPTVEVLEEIDGHPTLIRVRPYNAYRSTEYVQWLSADGNESYVRFDGALAHLEGVWVHAEGTPSVFRRVEARVVPKVEYVEWLPAKRGPREFRVAIDLDNVLHSYTSPWSASANIEDPPLPGAIAWLERLAAEGARIILHTCRFTQWCPHAAGFISSDPHEVEDAVWTWLTKHGLSDVACERITFWTWVGKPYADAYVDDKAVAFAGDFYGVDGLKGIVAASKARRIEALGA
jgi:hypothetical protein